MFFLLLLEACSFRSSPRLARSLPWPVRPAVKGVIVSTKALAVVVLATKRHPGRTTERKAFLLACDTIVNQKQF